MKSRSDSLGRARGRLRVAIVANAEIDLELEHVWVFPSQRTLDTVLAEQAVVLFVVTRIAPF